MGDPGQGEQLRFCAVTVNTNRARAPQKSGTVSILGVRQLSRFAGMDR
jgi:hypothetical protein